MIHLTLLLLILMVKTFGGKVSIRVQDRKLQNDFKICSMTLKSLPKESQDSQTQPLIRNTGYK